MRSLKSFCATISGFGVAILLPVLVWAVEKDVVAPAAKQSLGFIIDSFRKGGMAMYLILLCSIVGLYIFIEKVTAMRRLTIMPPQFIARLNKEVINSDAAHVVEFLSDKKYRKYPVARILSVGLAEWREGAAAVKLAIDTVGSYESARMRTSLPMLGLLGNVAPMLGLLGTVTGMIKAFDIIAKSGSGRPDLIADGISEALITTAYGLITGIPLLIIYYYLDSRVNNLVLDMEDVTITVVNKLMHEGDVGGF